MVLLDRSAKTAPTHVFIEDCLNSEILNNIVLNFLPRSVSFKFGLLFDFIKNFSQESLIVPALLFLRGTVKRN